MNSTIPFSFAGAFAKVFDPKVDGFHRVNGEVRLADDPLIGAGRAKLAAAEHVGTLRDIDARDLRTEGADGKGGRAGNIAWR